MGTDTKGKQEVEAELLAAATVFTDEVAQAVSIGESQHAIDRGLIREKDIIEIGAVITKAHPSRTSDDEITLFDGTGVGLQDLAVASAAVDLAVAKGAAVEIDFLKPGRASALACSSAFGGDDIAFFVAVWRQTGHILPIFRVAAIASGKADSRVSICCTPFFCSFRATCSAKRWCAVQRYPFRDRCWDW